MRIHGHLNYYPRLILNFAILAEPISKLLRKNEEFSWSQEQDDAYKKLQAALCSNPVVATFNNDDPVTLKTDASMIAIAGILTQCQVGEWRIVSCCSRNTNDAEKNYGVSELEGLAMVYSVTKFRNYLLGRKFKIYTDHCALCSLKIKTSKSPKLQR